MRFIVDCSVALKWVVGEVGSEAATRLFAYDLHAPDFMFLEYANALWKLSQRGEATAEQVAFKLLSLRQVRIQPVDLDGLLARALDIACLLQHSVYDCLYLAAAESASCRVITADLRLLRRVATSSLSHLAIGLDEAAAN